MIKTHCLLLFALLVCNIVQRIAAESPEFQLDRQGRLTSYHANELDNQLLGPGRVRITDSYRVKVLA